MCSQVPKNVQIIEYLTTTSAQITRERNNLTIWHERFDHLREQNLKLLIPKNLIIGSDPKLDRQLAFYVGCANGKQESIPERRSQENMAKSFGIGPHIFVQTNEDHFSGRVSILHDIHQ